MYNWSMYIFGFFLKIYGLINPKIGKWNSDRRLQKQNLPMKTAWNEEDPRFKIWFHCASLGEFEQARFIIDGLHKSGKFKILLTFFSPSGYEIRKNYAFADLVLYLPVDTHYNMKRFVDCFKPQAFASVKYEFWWNLFNVLNEKNIPKIFIALKFDKVPYFLNSKLFNRVESFRKNSVFFAQDDHTTSILRNVYPDEEVEIFSCGDPRVTTITTRNSSTSNISEVLIKSTGSKKVIIYGSIYPECMPVVSSFINTQHEEFAHILVPHDVSLGNIEQIKRHIQKETLLYSELETIQNCRDCVIIVDSVGVLFDLYNLAFATYVGGGFNKNVHNTLEPTRLGLPCAFGPKHTGFSEIDYFLKNSLAKEVRSSTDFENFIKQCEDLAYKSKVQAGLKNYFELNGNAGGIILDYVLEKYGRHN